MKTSYIAAAALSLMSLTCTAQSAQADSHPSPRPRFAVSSAGVAPIVVAALAARGIQASADQVKLPSEVFASEESPMLEVATVEKLGRLSGSQPGEQSASVKLRCKLATACHPFFAIATWQESAQARPAQPTSTSPAAPVKTAVAANLIAKPKAELQALQAEPSGVVIKTGQPLTLLMDGDHMRIQIAVISTTAGSVGQTIRVSTPDHKHFYLAQVLNGSMVKGTL